MKAKIDFLNERSHYINNHETVGNKDSFSPLQAYIKYVYGVNAHLKMSEILGQNSNGIDLRNYIEILKYRTD